jgi:hypothetical protein
MEEWLMTGMEDTGHLDGLFSQILEVTDHVLCFPGNSLSMHKYGVNEQLRTDSL